MQESAKKLQNAILRRCVRGLEFMICLHVGNDKHNII